MQLQSQNLILNSNWLSEIDLLEIGTDNNNVLGYIYIFVQETKYKFNEKLVNYHFNLTKKDPITGSNNYFDVYKFKCDKPNGIHYKICMHPAPRTIMILD